METAERKKAIFGIINKTLQSPPKVTAYYDNTDTYRIDMYIGADCPEKGFTTYSTIGLSEYPIYLTDITGRQIGVEYIGICQSGYTEFADILASCAFNIIKKRLFMRSRYGIPEHNMCIS